MPTHGKCTSHLGFGLETRTETPCCGGRDSTKISPNTGEARFRSLYGVDSLDVASAVREWFSPGCLDPDNTQYGAGENGQRRASDKA